MRLKIRDQLTAFVLLVTLTSIGVLAIVTWFNNYNLVTGLRESRLSLIARLKAEQVAGDLTLIDSAVIALSSRALLINALKRYYAGNNTDANWATSLSDLGLILSTQQQFLALSVFDPNMNVTLLNITSQSANNTNTTGLVPIYDASNSTVGFNSLDGHPGFSDSLYTHTIPGDGLLLGPVPSMYNASAQVASITRPIFNNTTVARNDRTVLGYVSMLFTCDNLVKTLSNENLTKLYGTTGQLLLYGPSSGNIANTTSGWPGKTPWRYVLPATTVGNEGKLGGFWDNIAADPDGGSIISTSDPATSKHIAAGFAPVPFTLVDWEFVIQQDYHEVSEPVRHLRWILIGTVFGMAGAVFIVTCVLAHFAVRPITRLRDATESTTRPPGYTPPASEQNVGQTGHSISNGYPLAGSLRKRGKWWQTSLIPSSKEATNPEDGFRIPEKVPDRKHFVTDELTELTSTFNNMTDELLKQYMHLEERVKQRTAELHEQTLLANAANDAKSMFIANVTHELRTPLNGILGMCSIVMTEPGLPGTVRRSLNTIYKSGELLLCLLTDLLTFSRNQVAGVNVTLEESEFKVKELVNQIKAIFTKTAREKKVELGIEVVNDNIDEKTGEPSVNGILRGDLNRILQVVINLMSNALKFTPENGSVQLRIVMLQDMSNVVIPDERIAATRKASMMPNVPKTAIINPKTAANQAIEKEKAAKVAASLAEPITTPNTSDGSTAVTYFDPSHFDRTSSDETTAKDPLVKTRWFEFSVIDTGPGIPSHMHMQIFEPFVQGDIGLSKKYGGTGLGLSICKQLAELMGGVIELKSFEGAGSTFTLRIPVLAGGLPAAPLPGTTRPPSLATTRFSRTVRRRGYDSQSINSDVSGAFSQFSANQVQDATRLVGYSQPYFTHEIADNDSFSSEKNKQTSPIQPVVETPPLRSSPMQINLPKASTSPVMSPIISREMSPLASPRTPFSAIAKEDYFATGNADGESSAITRVLSKGTKNVRLDDSKITRIEEGEPLTGQKPETTKPKAKSTKPKVKTAPSSIRVLVAEDNKVNQQVVKRMLKLENVTDVTISEDGQQAVDRVKAALESQTKYEIIFMDIQMPIMDGLQATKAIRDMGYQGPIIALTAFAEEKNVKDCFEVGIDYFLAKPVGRKQLKDVLTQYCPPSPLPDAQTTSEAPLL